MKCHFLAAGAIHVENRRTREAGVFLEQSQRLSVLSKSGEEPRVLFSGKPDHAQFRYHDRPTEDGSDSEQSKDEFSCDRRVIERKEETAAGCYDFKHSRVTGLSNNAVLEKRYLSFSTEAKRSGEWSGSGSRDMDGKAGGRASGK